MFLRGTVLVLRRNSKGTGIEQLIQLCTKIQQSSSSIDLSVLRDKEMFPCTYVRVRKKRGKMTKHGGEYSKSNYSPGDHGRNTRHVIWANCVLKHCLSLKTLIPNFIAFFLSLGSVISCIRKMSFSVTSAKREFTPAGRPPIVSLSTSREVDIVH